MLLTSSIAGSDIFFLINLFAGKDSTMIISLSDDLFQVLQDHSLLSKNYKQRSKILKAIFKMLDLEEPKLCLRLARLILAVGFSLFLQINSLPNDKFQTFQK